MNLGVEASKREWLRHLAQGETIPPPCIGARCVVIKERIYSYGGMTEEGNFLGAVYCLDPKNMKWIEVDTHIEGKPAPRSQCCLCVIGSRIVMFGGYDQCDNRLLQSGADHKAGWNNEIYELAIDTEERGELNFSISIKVKIIVGVCLDLKLSGTRPEPLLYPAMVSIDQNRAILFGRNSGQYSFMLNLHNEVIVNY